MRVHETYGTALTAACVLFSTGTYAQASSGTPKGVAPVATNQPAGRTYQATFQKNKPIQGTATGTAAKSGVLFDLDFSDFPDFATAGPFAYHIHVKPIPEDGNCTAAGGHLAPFNGPADNVTCNPDLPKFCQVGDLSGKHGKASEEKLSGESFLATYMDKYVSAIEGSEAYFGNRSIVIHAANGTRLNCGNFKRIDDQEPPQSDDDDWTDILSDIPSDSTAPSATSSAPTLSSLVPSAATQTGSGKPASTQTPAAASAPSQPQGASGSGKPTGAQTPAAASAPSQPQGASGSGKPTGAQTPAAVPTPSQPQGASGSGKPAGTQTLAAGPTPSQLRGVSGAAQISTYTLTTFFGMTALTLAMFGL